MKPSDLPPHDPNFVVAPDWLSHASCKNVDPQQFFHFISKNSTKRAKRVCAKCEVIEDCAYVAVRELDTFTLRGGMEPIERFVWLTDAKSPEKYAKYEAQKSVSAHSTLLAEVERVYGPVAA